jgi:signal transduction histidine kinase
MIKPPIPENEMNRLLSLSEFDLDYSNLDDNFKDLTKLAAKVAGTDISLVNLIDSFTQWTISSHGLEIDQMAREESVCQYTIVEESEFEVKDLSADERFKDRFYVKGEPNIRYYFGVPLKTNDGSNIGALCVLDSDVKSINPEKIELLKIISDEIVNRLTALKIIEGLKYSLSEAKQNQKKVAHDIRGPIGGIIGLAQIISEQGDENKLDEVLEFINLIQKSGNSLLELADEILSTDQPQKINSDQFNLAVLKDKLDKLYSPQAVSKNIKFTVHINSKADKIPFSKNKLLQIIGNLVSNAMKFTPQDGSIFVELDLVKNDLNHTLKIIVRDSGVGLNQDGIDAILNGTAVSTNGTSGENGYGFGLALVKHLIEGLKGSLNIYSKVGEGATFEISLPQR